MCQIILNCEQLSLFGRVEIFLQRKVNAINEIVLLFKRNFRLIVAAHTIILPLSTKTSRQR